MTSNKSENHLADNESLARSRIMELWKPGNLFYNFPRYPKKKGYEQIDRLAGILKRGIVPPALDTEGVVVSDLSINIKGAAYSYDQVVYLHRFGRYSAFYIPNRTETIACFIDPDTLVLTPADMGEGWPVLCRDEVYVPRIIRQQELIGIAVAADNLQSIYAQFQQEITTLGLPLYDFGGGVFWPK